MVSLTAPVKEVQRLTTTASGYVFSNYMRHGKLHAERAYTAGGVCTKHKGI